MKADPGISQQIDAIIKAPGDWRGRKLSQLRELVKKADPDIVEEIKWKKPSSPLGVPVWSHDGIVCIGVMLKNVVRLSFLKGAQVKDPKKLFNACLEGNAMRAIDLKEEDDVDEKALKEIIHAVIALNTAAIKKKKG